MATEQYFRSSQARLAVAYGVVVMLLVGTLLGAVYLATRSGLERQIRTMVDSETENLVEELRIGGVGQLANTLRERSDSWGRLGAVYVLADSSLQSIAGNLTEWPSDVRPVDGATVQFRIVAHERATQVSHPVEARCKRLAGGYWLLVGTDTSERDNTVSRFGYATLWGVGMTTLLIAVLGWWYSRRTLRRAREFAATCESIMHGDLTRRLKVEPSYDELDALSSTVNTMLDRLEQQTGMLRATFQSIAHDLRTPLYRLRVRLEEALLSHDATTATHELVAPALAEIDGVQRTLITLLEIARAESGDQDGLQEQVDLVALARELTELYAPGMQDSGLTLTLEIHGEAVIAGRRQLLAQLIVNLLENTLKYVPAGNTVKLVVRGDTERVSLQVSDSGPGIPAAERERVLLPFVRLQDSVASTPSSGLGLSLVAAIARLHSADLMLSDGHPGLKVVCTFPRASRVRQ